MRILRSLCVFSSYVAGLSHVARFLPWLAMAPLSLPAAAFSAEPVVEGTVQRLELLDQFEVPKQRSNPRDIRFASKETVILGFELDGVAERELVEGLPLRRALFPGYEETPGLQLVNLATDGDQLSVAGHLLGWAETAGSSAGQPEFKELRGFYDDIDVRDDTLALLGYPTAEQFAASHQTYLWLGDLRSKLEQWRPLPALKEDRGRFGSTPGIGSMGQRLGSLRFLRNGDLLVVPAFKPGVFRLSRHGKLRNSWSLEELEASLLEATGGSLDEASPTPLVLEAKPPTTESTRLYISSQRILVEDVLPVRKSGAIVVRYGSGIHTKYYLAVLESELTWHELPIEADDRTDRIRADSRDDRLVVLVTNRGRAKSSRSRVFLTTSP